MQDSIQSMYGAGDISSVSLTFNQCVTASNHLVFEPVDIYLNGKWGNSYQNWILISLCIDNFIGQNCVFYAIKDIHTQK